MVRIIPRELIRHLEWKPGDSVEETGIKPKIYLEKTIPSYLTAWPSRDLITAANQQTTRDWWAFRKDAFELYISQLVICKMKDAKIPAINIFFLDLPAIKHFCIQFFRTPL